MADDEGTPKKAAPSKASLQLKKLSEANAKYKDLLKLAKERIQKQEDELETLRHEKATLEDQIENEAAVSVAQNNRLDEETYDDSSMVIIRVCQRIKVPVAGGLEEIWALFLKEAQTGETIDASQPPTRVKEWKRFDTESELQDFIRRDTGEPLQLPSYALSPDQSKRIQHEAQQQVAAITEEFRRFRVKSELLRKQTDAQIRELQSNKAQSAAQRILQGDQKHNESSASAQVEQMRVELATQEAHWKEAYDVLMQENQALKSSGSDALLASQWRQRYEQCLKEKEVLENTLNQKKTATLLNSNGEMDYEQKYKDLKESFKLYRKKAKEIFESQGGAENRGGPLGMSINDASSAESKLDYLKNLMVNYLTSDPEVRDHMETAICTVLRFTPDDRAKVAKKKAELESWF